MRTALIVVDIQNDFCPGGSLAVNDGDKIIPLINLEIPRFDRIVITQDWHPTDHGSFASTHKGGVPFEMGELSGEPQMLWPDHCIEYTEGAKLHADFDIGTKLDTSLNIKKGQDPSVDSYSAFYDNDGKNDTGLSDWLRKQQVKYVFVCGLALDYCVKFTALDAAKEGFTTYILGNLTRPVDMDNVQSTIEELIKSDVTVI